MRIVVADADSTAAQALSDTLSRWGHDTKTVGDAGAAWTALQDEDAVDMLILSATLPGTDPLELCRRIRQRPRARYLYVLLLGDRGAAPPDFGIAIRSGVDDAMWRPLDLRELQGRTYMAHRAIRT